MVKLTKKQLGEAIKTELLKENGLNEVFKLTLDGLMYLERSEYLKDSDGNKGNGYRPKRNIGFGSSFRLSIPRDRFGSFKPFILDLLKEDENRIKDVCFELYSKGLTTKDVGSIIKKLYGKSYSESSITNITKSYYKEMESWRNRPLSANWAVIYIDAVFVKVRRDTVQSEAFYVLLGLKEDLKREVLGIYNYPTESSSSWIEIAKDIKKRGVKNINLWVSDDLTGIEDALKQEFPTTPLQTCIVHYERNLMKHIRPNHKHEFGKDLKEIFQPNRSDDSKEKAQQRMKDKAEKWKNSYPKIAAKMLDDAKNKYVLFEYLNYNYEVRSMIYTTNWIERLNKSFRKTLKVRGSLPSVDSALVLMTKTAMDMESGAYSYKIHIFEKDEKLLKF